MARGALGTRGTRSARRGMGQVPGQAQRARPAAEAPVLILPPRAGSFRVWPPRSPRLQPASPGARTPVTIGPALRHTPPPRRLLPSRQNPRKGAPGSAGAFFLTGGWFSWDATFPRGPLILTSSPPRP